MEKYSGIPAEGPWSLELKEIHEKCIDVNDELFEVQHLFEKFGIPMDMTLVKTVVDTMEKIEQQAKDFFDKV